MALIQAVAEMFETYLLGSNDKTPVPEKATYFHTNRTPAISVREYLLRLETYMKCSEECYLLALIYIDRIVNREPDIVINSHCIHRLILTGVVIAAKFVDDVYYKNSYYAHVGGISIRELNLLEHQFLSFLDFNLYITYEDFNFYQTTLMNHFHKEHSKLYQLVTEETKEKHCSFSVYAQFTS